MFYEGLNLYQKTGVNTAGTLYNMHNNIPGQYSTPVLHHYNSPCRNKVEHNEHRVEVPLFPDSYSLCVERCQILVWLKDLLLKGYLHGM